MSNLFFIVQRESRLKNKLMYSKFHDSPSSYPEFAKDTEKIYT